MSVSNVNTNFSKIYSGKLTIPLLFDILINAVNRQVSTSADQPIPIGLNIF